MMRSRKGMELAINTVVVLILGVLILGGGIALVWQITNGANQLAGEVTQAQRQRLSELYGDGQLVAIAPQSVDTLAGERGQVAVGVRSILPQDATFAITLVGTGPDRNPVAIGPQVDSWRFQYFPDLAVNAGVAADSAIAFASPKDAPVGIYTFIVTVKQVDESGNPTDVYDSPRFFTVRVS